VESDQPANSVVIEIVPLTVSAPQIVLTAGGDMDDRNAARWLNWRLPCNGKPITPRTLQYWRSMKQEPVWTKLGKRITYNVADLTAYAETGRRDPLEEGDEF
jgi:hypothetical protein